MTIWIKNLYEELVEGYVKGKDSRELSLLHDAIYHRLIKFGLSECYFTGFCLYPKATNIFYLSYVHFQNGLKSYALDRRKSTAYCELSKAFFSEKLVEVSLEHPKSKKKTRRLVVLGLARQKLKTEWWYNKEGYYTNHLFDYPAYNPRYKASPRFWRSPGEKEVYGHEFELKFASLDHKIGFATRIKEHFAPCITEKDGSLDDGETDGGSLELITPPWSYEESLKQVSQIFSLAQEFNPKAMNNGYAWHVTVNLANAADIDTAGLRLMQIFNYPIHRAFWQSIARRPSAINPATGRNYCKFEDDVTMSYRTWNKRWASTPVDHYYATFLRKCGRAIEIRLLKSTLDFQIFAATLEIVKAAWDFSKGSAPIESWLKHVTSLSSGTNEFIRKCSQSPRKKIIPAFDPYKTKDFIHF